ncbi:MAG: putative 2OG-Fe(II) oxygenase [Rhizomicrobium sp.]
MNGAAVRRRDETAGPRTEAVPEDAFRLELPLPRQFTVQDELALLLSAHSRFSLPQKQRDRFAGMLFQMDRFGEAIDLLRAVETRRSYENRMLLAAAHLARTTESDNAAALEVLIEANGLAATPTQHATALAELGKAMLRLCRADEAREAFLAALRSDPANADAFRRLALLDIGCGAAAEVLGRSNVLVDGGLVHPYLLAVRALAFAVLDRMDEARETFGFERFGHGGVLSPPPGWSSIEMFNMALAEEIACHPGLRYERVGTASLASWRVDDPLLERSVLLPLLLEAIRRKIVAYVAAMPAYAPFARTGRASRATLTVWSVLTRNDGFEDWHIHPSAWLSGVYYVEVPCAVRSGGGKAGCIEFGAPPAVIGAQLAARLGTHVVRPQAGRFMLFPSHNYHRTYPHDGDGRRICVAFDVVSQEARSTTETHGPDISV